MQFVLHTLRLLSRAEVVKGGPGLIRRATKKKIFCSFIGDRTRSLFMRIASPPSCTFYKITRQALLSFFVIFLAKTRKIFYCERIFLLALRIEHATLYLWDKPGREKCICPGNDGVAVYSISPYRIAGLACLLPPSSYTCKCAPNKTYTCVQISKVFTSLYKNEIILDPDKFHWNVVNRSLIYIIIYIL